MIRVMVVDDSPLARKVTSEILEQDPGITVVATAASAEIALRKLEQLKPDVVTMDLEMPGIDGLEAIRRIMRNRPVPVVVLSAFAVDGADLTIRALEAGAVDFVTKPRAGRAAAIADIAAELKSAVIQASLIDPKPVKEISGSVQGFETLSMPASIGKRAETRYEVVALGASAGGPVAVKEVLRRLPGHFPIGILIVLHMPPVFTAAYADRLDTLCALSVREAAAGDRLLPGTALLAPGNQHMSLERKGTEVRVRLERSEPVSGHRPSVDVLMSSVAEVFGARALGVIMTGMGRDGAGGIARMKERGGYVIAQDQASSTIFGMNRTVIENGDADEVVCLDSVAERIMRLCLSPEGKEKDR